MPTSDRYRVDLVRKPTDHLVRELQELRKRTGVSVGRMAEARTLCALPIVDQELIRQRRPEADRRYVAHDVLRCSITNIAITSPMYGMILSRTLNLERERNDLMDRRVAACDDLVKHFGVRGTGSEPVYPDSKRYQNPETEAYEHLAGVLSALEANPCAVSSSEGISAKVEGHVAVLFARADLNDARWRRLAKLFGDVVDSTSRDTLYTAADLILETIPRGRRLALETWGFADSLAAVTRLATESIGLYFGAWAMHVNLNPFPVFRLQVNLLDPDLFRGYWRTIGRGDAVGRLALLEELSENVAAEMTPADQLPGRYAEDEIPEFNDALEWLYEAESGLNYSMILLSYVFWALELSSDWESLDPGSRSRASASAPLAPILT